MNWPSYNQSLVRRGEILLGFDVIDNWDSELKEMNKDKVGEPFQYPNTFLLLLGYAKVFFHLAYRQTEGIAKGHAKGKIPLSVKHLKISLLSYAPSANTLPIAVTLLFDFSISLTNSCNTLPS